MIFTNPKLWNNLFSKLRGVCNIWNVYVSENMFQSIFRILAQLGNVIPPPTYHYAIKHLMGLIFRSFIGSWSLFVPPQKIHSHRIYGMISEVSSNEQELKYSSCKTVLKPDFRVTIAKKTLWLVGRLGSFRECPNVPFSNHKGVAEEERFTSAPASILRCHAARMSIHLSYHEDHNSLWKWSS